MRIETIDLSLGSAGTQRSLTVYRFGGANARPKLYVQSSLHADEIPGMLVSVHLCNRLEALEAEGKLRGQIVVVPVANPIGLSQSFQGKAFGRFALADGLNFNRHFANLTDGVAARALGNLGKDAHANVNFIRNALLQEIDRAPIIDEVSALRSTLLKLAIDADVVLDLHCDGESVVHIYTATHLESRIEPLAASLGARALLTAEVSGDDPFDEAVSRPWVELARMFPEHPIPASCVSATVELRGESDVSTALATRDAEAILDFAAREGLIDTTLSASPAPLCRATPLAGVLPIVAPHAGVIAFVRVPGDRVRVGDIVARIVDPMTRRETELKSEIDGLMFARTVSRYAIAGQRLAKIAGSTPVRSGKLLSP
jgi:uncharacterized protein